MIYHIPWEHYLW